MSGRKFKLAWIGLVLFMIGGSVMQAAVTPFMSLTEMDDLLKSGQPVTGYFESVPEGLAKHHYPVIIKGIAETPFGPEIIFTSRNHIVAGMSGSPVYVRGKKIGALATSQNIFERGPFWGGITPIKLMLREDREALALKSNGPSSFYYQGRLFSPIALGHQPLPAELITEFEKRGWPASFLKSSRFVMTKKTDKNSKRQSILDKTPRRRLLQPGMPIVVDLIEWTDQEGNINLVSALGTITHVDQKTGRVYAFGHPFLDAKKARYTFRSAEIMGTTISDFNSYKVAGRKSEVLGLIDYDSSSGIYGRIGLEGMELLPRFDLELKREGQNYQKLQVRLGDSRSFLPLFFQYSLIVMGKAYGAPVADEASSTEWDTQIRLKGYPPLHSYKSFSSLDLKTEDAIVRRSSYDVASEDFIVNAFLPLFHSSYRFTFQSIILRANFFPHKLKQIKLAALKFPTKVVWGEDPVLEIKMVGEDNALVLEKKTRVKVDWSKVQIPIYGSEFSELEKDKDKVVNGRLVIFSTKQSPVIIKSEKEKQQEYPDYFLGPEDFLSFFEGHLRALDQTIRGKLYFRPQQNNVEEGDASSRESVLDLDTKTEDEQWRVIPGGLSQRWPTSSDNVFYSFVLQFPDFPSGFVADPNLNKSLVFEVVKK